MKDIENILQEIRDNREGGLPPPIVVVCETEKTAMLWCPEGFPNAPNVEGSIMFVHDLPEDGWAFWDTMCQMGEPYRQELNDRLQYGPL